MDDERTRPVSDFTDTLVVKVDQSVGGVCLCPDLTSGLSDL